MIRTRNALILALTCSILMHADALDSTIQETIDQHDARIAQEPESANAHFSYGDYLASLDLYDYYEKALFHLKKATQLQPNNLQWLFQLGSYACRIGKLQESLNAYKKILEHNPSLTSVLYNAGFSLKTAGDYTTAIKLYQHIVSHHPDYAPAHLGLAFAHLAQGNYADGWKEHAWNITQQGKDSPELRAYIANGTIAGKRILLTYEGGLGDTLNFIRYAQRIKEMGAHVTVVVQAPLIPILSRCHYIDTLVTNIDPIPGYHAKATLMSLAAFFEDDERTIPQNIPYIFPDPERLAYWQEQLKNDTNFKIGICWQPDTHNDVSRLPIARRGIPLSHFYSLASTPGITLYSLQKKEGLDQLNALPENVTIKAFGQEFDETHGSFMDTAALMHSLDLIISTDTATAHLAGAMGRPTWLLLPFNADWRWLAGRSDTPWYPTMRIFQQEKPFNWESIIKKLHETFFNEIYTTH